MWISAFVSVAGLFFSVFSTEKRSFERRNLPYYNEISRLRPSDFARNDKTISCATLTFAGMTEGKEEEGFKVLNPYGGDRWGFLFETLCTTSL